MSKLYYCLFLILLCCLCSCTPSNEEAETKVDEVTDEFDELYFAELKNTDFSDLNQLLHTTLEETSFTKFGLSKIEDDDIADIGSDVYFAATHVASNVDYLSSSKKYLEGDFKVSSVVSGVSGSASVVGAFYAEEPSTTTEVYEYDLIIDFAEFQYQDDGLVLDGVMNYDGGITVKGILISEASVNMEGALIVKSGPLYFGLTLELEIEIVNQILTYSYRVNEESYSGTLAIFNILF